MLLNVISLTKLFTITYFSITIKKFEMIEDPLQLFWPAAAGVATNYL